jgi:hypothetical protein
MMEGSRIGAIASGALMAVCLLIVIFLLAACGPGHAFFEGDVHEKSYEPPHEYQTYVTNYCMIGKVMMACGGYWQTHYDDADYYITIVNCEHAKDEHDPCPQETFQVDQATYDSLEVGMWVEFEEE